MKLLEKIRLWWKFEGQYYHKDFAYGVKNLIKWFPVIWKDRDWDDHFIWRIMIQKLKNQSKYIGQRDYHTRAKRDAEIMMTCVRLMERVSDEYYNIEYMDYHDSDYNFIDSKDHPGYKELEIVENWEKYDDYFAKYPLVHKAVLKEYPNETDKYRIAMMIAHKNHNRARKLLFNLMDRNIECWWD